MNEADPNPYPPITTTSEMEAGGLVSSGMPISHLDTVVLVLFN